MVLSKEEKASLEKVSTEMKWNLLKKGKSIMRTTSQGEKFNPSILFKKV